MDERLSDFAYMEPDRMQKRYRRSTDDEVFEERTRSKREIPHIIYPEILVIVDYDGYRLHGGDNVQVSADIIKSWKRSVNTCCSCFQIKRYFVSFWNGVDLRYRLLKGPKIRISIAGIIISRVSTLFSNSEWTAYVDTCDGIKKGHAVACLLPSEKFICEATFCDYVSIILCPSYPLSQAHTHDSRHEKLFSTSKRAPVLAIHELLLVWNNNFFKAW